MLGDDLEGLRRRVLWIESVVVGGLALLGAVGVFQLWRQGIGSPFNYDGDGPYYLMLAQGLKQHGSFLTNPDLGFPAGQVLYDVPENLDLANIAVLRLLTLVTGAVEAVNVFILATFALVGGAAHAVLRKFGLHPVIAGVLALLYAFLPYHLMRRGSHLFLGSYALVPVVVWYAVALLGDRTPSIDVRRAAGRCAFAACVGVALTGPYYATFALLLWPIAGVLAAIRRRVWSPVLGALQMVAVVAAVAVAALVPNLWYWARNGRNSQVIQRTEQETEALGIRIQQLLMPRWDHRNGLLSRLGLDALRGPVESEGTQYLGIIGAVGFLVLLVVCFVRLAGRRSGDDRRWTLLDRLAVITLAALLIGVGSGFGYFVNRFGLRQIRAYNRLSVLIGFCALVAVGVVATVALERIERRSTGRARTVLAVGAVLAAFVGWYDQTSPRDATYVSSGRLTWELDREFFAGLDAALPDGAAVLQLPEISFPENTGVGRIAPYDEGRGYVHAPSLDWSFGGVTGRHSGLPPGLVDGPGEAIVDAARASGFRAVLVDRHGYADSAVELEARLAAAGLSIVAVGSNNRYAWYDLDPGADDGA